MNKDDLSDAVDRSKSFILIALKSLDEINKQTLNKIEIQKVLYLAFTVSSITEFLSPQIDFLYHKRGPYSEALQIAIDWLVATNYVHVINYEPSEEKAKVQYRLSDRGRKIVPELLENEIYNEAYQVLISIILILDLIGWKFLVNLVYQEPTLKQTGRWRNITLFKSMNFSEEVLIEMLSIIKTRVLNMKDISLVVSQNFIEYLYSKYKLAKTKNN